MQRPLYNRNIFLYMRVTFAGREFEGELRSRIFVRVVLLQHFWPFSFPLSLAFPFSFLPLRFYPNFFIFYSVAWLPKGSPFPFYPQSTLCPSCAGKNLQEVRFARKREKHWRTFSRNSHDRKWRSRKKKTLRKFPFVSSFPTSFLFRGFSWREQFSTSLCVL